MVGRQRRFTSNTVPTAYCGRRVLQHRILLNDRHRATESQSSSRRGGVSRVFDAVRAVRRQDSSCYRDFEVPGKVRFSAVSRAT